ncbi:hypothetical protein WG68_11840 [Arsukibacterium ikkense]|uniref:GGDEF domain-containing protein n=1 Tax=Arsukibacterium ikkense TaxID=336831 RepID=A0A0M2V657_9GAMM|nr:GGDEF domain-containing protein [Arsukibacterium ikkense]KKO45120.1 hypothetical protein WG68_11840 [Arsukibacterium ikkense]
MQSKPNGISHIYGVWPILHHKILLAPRRSYAQLEQALQRAEDLTERTLCEMLALRQSQQSAEHTDTPDKQHMRRQLQFMIKQAQRHSHGFALLFVQLDHYQNIGQRYGITVAKQVSELTLARMLAVVRECDSISQQADGQFLLLITDVSRIYDAVLVAEKLMQKLTLLNGICPEPLDITASIGISRFPEDGNDASLLIERAAAAMLHAQSRGGNQFSLLR